MFVFHLRQQFPKAMFANERLRKLKPDIKPTDCLIKLISFY